MPTQRTWITGVTAAGLVATSLVAAPAFAEDAPADAPAVEAVLSDAPVEESIPEPTTSDVALLPVEAPAGYTASAEVPEPTGDAQQEELLRADADDADSRAARIELNSDIAVFGASWGADAAAPASIEYRTLVAGTWSAWDELEVAPVADSVERDGSSHATEPAFITDAEAVEVLAVTAAGDPVEDLALAVVDPRGEAPVENSLEPAERAGGAGGAGETPPAPEQPLNEPEPEGAAGTPPEETSPAPVPESPKPESQAPESPAPESPAPEQPDPGRPAPATRAADGPTMSTVLDESKVGTVLGGPEPAIDSGVYRGEQAGVAPAASASTLTINTRKSWGGPAHTKANGLWVSPSTKYRGAVVHHTAGGNNYTRAQVPGIIRGIYQYHLSVNYGDVGYQLLVDKYGGVWEGRYGSLSRQLVGAQAYGANYETFGISVLGNYEQVALPKAAQTSTARAIAWMFDKWNLTSAKGSIRVSGGDGRGRTVPVISGHRDIGSGTAWATVCPGRYFYPKLPAIRDQVQSYLTPPLSGMVKRRWDSDRFGTAAKIALASHPNGADTVYIAAGMDFPDTLSGGAAAGIDGAPVLLTLTKSLPAQTASALQKLAPKNIVILGGTGSVNGTVASRLKSYGKVVRYGGADRYETAAKVARAKAPDADVVYIASGSDFPDALSGVPIAGADRAPLLLTEKNRLPAVTRAEIQRMRPKRIIILGGTGVVGSNVANALKSYGTVARRAGSDRFDTAVKTAQAKYTGTVNTVYVANGMDFPDALAGGPAAKKENGPLLLVTRDGVPAQTAAALAKMQPKKIVLLGGTGAVSAANERRLDAFITE